MGERRMGLHGPAGARAAEPGALPAQNASGAGALPPPASSLAGAFKDAAEQLGSHLTEAVRGPLVSV